MNSGWFDLKRVFKETSRDNVSLIAAGLALYALLAVFPALAAAVSLYGLVSSPDQIAAQIQNLSGVLPQQAADILRTALRNLASQQSQALGVVVLLMWLYLSAFVVVLGAEINAETGAPDTVRFDDGA